MNLGNKITILGVSGAGKSILARTLSQKLKLPLYQTDRFIWQNGWENGKLDEEIVVHVNEILLKPEWLLEGYIGYTDLPDKRLCAADTVIVLDYSRILLSWRVFKRHLFYHGKNRIELPESCKEKFGWNTVQWIGRFLGKKTLHKNLYNWIANVDRDKLLVFKNPKQLKKWLKQNNLSS
jgi:adenylate kinase family enzyme